MVDPVQVAQFAVNGIVLGSILSLTAVGLTLVYGILDLANFAHGDLVTMGAYLGLFFLAMVEVASLTRWTVLAALALVGAALWERTLRPRVADLVADLEVPGADALSGHPKISVPEAVGLAASALLLLALLAGWRRPGWAPGGTLFLAVPAVATLGVAARAGTLADDPVRLLGGGVAASAALLVAGLVLGWTEVPLLLALLPLLAASLHLHPDPVDDPWTFGLLAVVLAGGALLVADRLLLAAAMAMLVTALIVAALEWVVWRPMRRQDAGLLTLLIISIGLALALRNVIQIRFGSEFRPYPGPVERARYLLGTGVQATPGQLLVVGIGVLTILAVHVLLSYTRIGKAMRALSDDVDLARVTGIDVDRVVLYVWIIAGSLTTLSGILLGLLRNIHPNLGWFLLLPIFSAVILGGIGSAYGAMAGGYVIGIAMEVSPAFGLPVAYKPAVGFAAMILVLLFRPQGIAGGDAAR